MGVSCEFEIWIDMDAREAEAIWVITVVKSFRSSRSSVSPAGTLTESMMIVEHEFLFSLMSEYPLEPLKVQFVAELAAKAPERLRRATTPAVVMVFGIVVTDDKFSTVSTGQPPDVLDSGTLQSDDNTRSMGNTGRTNVPLLCPGTMTTPVNITVLSFGIRSHAWKLVDERGMLCCSGDVAPYQVS